MIHSKKRYKSRLLSLLDIWQIQFVTGFFLCLFIVGILVWGSHWQNWFSWQSRMNSFIAMTGVYLLSFVSIRRFSVYLGQLNLRHITLVIFLWIGLILGALFVFRFLYSVYFLVFSCLAITIFFPTVSFLRNRYGRQVIAYVPEGRIDNLPTQDTVIWKKLSDCAPIDKQQTDIVMADLRADLSDEWEQFLAECTLRHIPVYHSGRLIEMVSGRVKIDHMYENDLGSLLPSKSYQFTKRLLDIALVLISLPLVFPVMLITAVLIVLESRGGVFFLQERVGQGGAPFIVYKFRSMSQDSEKAGAQFAQANDMRVTRIGKVIRKTRIDELPQFFNVLKGEMSLIGPRPEQKKFVDDFKKDIPFYDYRHIVKPGISGWAQVVHGYAADTEDTKVKLEHDFYYIKNFSFSLDLLIFFKTIQTMLTGFGAR